MSIILVITVTGISFVALYVTISSVILFSNLFFSLPLVARKDSQDEHVLITGGSSGIGLELAKLYLQQGKKVTIVARNVSKLAAATKSLDSSRVISVSVDVSSSEKEVVTAFQSAIKQNGAVDILINCAGISYANEFEEIPQEEWERLLRVNVLGSVFPTKAVVPTMKERRKGKIIFVSSQVGQAAIHGYSAYAASKWALRGLAEALQMELKAFHISVSVAFPPDTDTPGYQEEMKSKPAITAALSETGSVFSAASVAADIATGVAQSQFSISSGFDGWLLRQLHGGMGPINNALEVTQQVLLSSFFRFIAVFYLFYWDSLIIGHNNKNVGKDKKKSE